MINATINFFDSVPLYPGWLFLFFFGLFFIKLTKYRKLGIRYLIIFSVPLGIFTLAFWLMDYEYLNCMLNGSSEAMENC